MKILKYLLNFLLVFVTLFLYNKLSKDYSTKVLNIIEIVVFIINLYLLFYIKPKIIKIIFFILFCIEFVFQVSPTINDMILFSNLVLYLIGTIRIISIFSAFYLIFDEKILGIIIFIKSLLYYVETFYEYNFLLTGVLILFIILRDIYIDIKKYKCKSSINNDV